MDQWITMKYYLNLNNFNNNNKLNCNTGNNLKNIKKRI